MKTVMENLEPQSLWRHFEALSAIPRASEKEAAARRYVLAQAARLGLESTTDGVGNIVVRKPARPGREGAVGAVLQGHLDMVCEKNEGTVHNFDTDPIRLVREGDWLKADGTTLGADNGVGVAAALAVMESAEVAHGPLEFLFTIDEESGLTGAAQFRWTAPGQILPQPGRRGRGNAVHRLRGRAQYGSAAQSSVPRSSGRRSVVHQGVRFAGRALRHRH